MPDTTPTLTLHKTTHSVHPWRIGLRHADGRFEAIPHLTFARKRDAVPVLEALQVLTLDWDLHPQAWTTAVWDAVHALIEASPRMAGAQPGGGAGPR